MKVQVIQAWLNYTVKIQRRPPGGGVNSLGEPAYNDPATWPVVLDPFGNPTHKVRIEFNVESMMFTPTGERVIQNQTLMFIRADDYLQPEDRITILNTNIDPLLNSYFIAHAVWPENDAVGNVSHYVAELQVI